jgi:hypothetical protein
MAPLLNDWDKKLILCRAAICYFVRRGGRAATFSESLTIYVIYSGPLSRTRSLFFHSKSEGFCQSEEKERGRGNFYCLQSDALMYMEENGVMGQSIRINNAHIRPHEVGSVYIVSQQPLCACGAASL